MILKGGIGIIDKFIDGITDFSKGYNENKNTAFSPENLRRRQDLATFKQSINPADYTTRLTPDEQKQFNTWANDMKIKGLINPNDNFQDYDMQGYWKNEVLNSTDLANGNAEAHFTDKYKMPNHETFSNESIYATGENAKYAGSWDNNRYVTPLKNNKMTRAGEVLGTISRVAKKAGGIARGLTPYVGRKIAQNMAQGIGSGVAGGAIGGGAEAGLNDRNISIGGLQGAIIDGLLGGLGGYGLGKVAQTYNGGIDEEANVIFNPDDIDIIPYYDNPTSFKEKFINLLNR